MLGRFLFRWRGVIGVLAFGVVFWLARPTFGSCLLGVPLLVAGLAVRFWASGYIGIEGRVREIGMQSEEGGASRSRIVTGPYRILRHPLYIGNFLLVLGMLAALRPTAWLSVAVMIGFVVEYGLIVGAEEQELAGRRIQSPESRIQNAEVEVNGSRESGVGSGTAFDRSQRSDGRSQKAEGQMAERGRSHKREARSESAELRDRIVQNSETRNQNSEFRIAVNSRREAEGESFSLRRAMCEWRTWVVTGVGWGVAVVKALLIRI